MPQSVFQARRGFCRGEWLLLLGVLIILFSVAGSLVWTMRIRHRSYMAASDLRVLGMAINRYYEEYGHWPLSQTDRNADARLGRTRSNAELINTLSARAGSGNINHVSNPARIVFLEVPKAEGGWSGLNDAGAFIDPWGEEYQVALDTDLDNKCFLSESRYGVKRDRGFCAWSLGPDRKQDSPDDVLSWKL